MRKIKIAQIGINRYSHAPEIFSTLAAHPELFELVGYALVEDERETCAEKIEKFLSGYPELTLEEILLDESIEAVTVETDEIHLLKYAQMAAEHGKHIHMEKPGSQDLAAFERLIETVRAGGKTFHIGYMYRYNPIIEDTLRRVKAGELGKIWSVEAHMSRYDGRECREWLGTFRGGMMFYLGCHLVDLVLQFQGMPSEVLPLNTASGLDGVDSEDIGFAVLKYPNGISVIRMAGCEVGGFRRRQLVVCGTERTVEIAPLEAEPEGVTKKYRLYTEMDDRYLNEEGRTAFIHTKSENYHRYEAMLFAFAAMVRGEKENPYTLDYELELFRTILKCCGMNV